MTAVTRLSGRQINVRGRVLRVDPKAIIGLLRVPLDTLERKIHN